MIHWNKELLLDFFNLDLKEKITIEEVLFPAQAQVVKVVVKHCDKALFTYIQGCKDLTEVPIMLDIIYQRIGAHMAKLAISKIIEMEASIDIFKSRPVIYIKDDRDIASMFG